MGWQQGRAMGRDEPSTPSSQTSDNVADLEASVVTWRHLLQGVLGDTPHTAIQVNTSMFKGCMTLTQTETRVHIYMHTALVTDNGCRCERGQ